MALYKTSTFFTDNTQIAGWSETHYLQANSDTDAVASMQILNSFRRSWLAQNCAIIACRISYTAQKRQAILITNGQGFGEGNNNLAMPAFTSEPSDAVVIQLRPAPNSGNNRIGRVFCRGIADYQWLDPTTGQFSPQVDIQKLIAPWVACLSAANGLPAGAAFQIFVTTNVTVGPNVTFVGTLAQGFQVSGTAALFAPGNIYRFPRVPSASGLQGYKTCTQANSNTDIRFGGLPPVVVGFPVITLSQISRASVQIGGVVPEKLSIRKTGRPFGLLRGRRRNYLASSQ